MMKKDNPPPPIVTKTKSGLHAAAAFFADQIAEDPIGTEYDLVKRTRRSHPQNALYWMALDKVVKATDKWPTKTHLHRDLKLVCGYTYQTVNWDTGDIVNVIDSTSFDDMNSHEFKKYFDLAMMKLSEHIGFDPIENLD